MSNNNGVSLVKTTGVSLVKKRPVSLAKPNDWTAPVCVDDNGNEIRF